MLRVLGFGDNVVDKYEHTKKMYPGGNSLNFAVFTKDNHSDSAYMGIFGNDNEAEHVIDTIEKKEIELFKCKQYPGENGCARVSVKNGERIFLGSNEGGVRKERIYELDRFDIKYINTFDLVHSGNYSYTETQLKKIRETNVKVSFDFSDDSNDSYISEVAPLVDYAFISLANLSTEEAKRKIMMIQQKGSQLVIGSKGAKGVIAYDGQSFYLQDSIETQVVDTMGAGDGLIGAFLVHYLTNVKEGSVSSSKEHVIKESLYKGVCFASKVCKIDGSFGFGKAY